MEDVDVLKCKLIKREHEIKQLQYDIERLDFLLGECMILLDTVEKRSTNDGDSFTAVWCNEMKNNIQNILNKPRYGVDIITLDQVKDTK